MSFGSGYGVAGGRPQGGNDIVLPSQFGPVSMGTQSWGMAGSRVVPSSQTQAAWHPSAHAHPSIREQQQPRPAAAPPPPQPEPRPEQNADLRRQQLARQLWQAQEEDLTRRVTMMENLIRRTVDLPCFDVAGDPGAKKNGPTGESYERNENAPGFSLQGPVAGQQDWQVKDESGSVFYIEPEMASKQAQSDVQRAEATMEWRSQNPVTMFMAGDPQYVAKALYLDTLEEETYYSQQAATGGWRRVEGR